VTAADLVRWRSEEKKNSAKFRSYLTALRRTLLRNEKPKR